MTSEPLDFMQCEMISYRCSRCHSLKAGPDDGCNCKPTENYFVEGAVAYLNWYEANCEGDMPESPYASNSTADKHWVTGFDDAMNYMLYGQFNGEGE